MKQVIDIRSGEVYRFNAGQAGKYLIMREASQSVILRGDAMRPLEVERGDTIDVSRFDELEFHNQNSTSVFLEYQIADVEVRIKSQSTAVSGALDINEVHTPIVIARIQEPIDVNVAVPTVDVNIPDVKVVMPSEIAISNIPVMQTVTGVLEVSQLPQVDSKPTQVNGLPIVRLDASGLSEISENPRRKGVMIQASSANKSEIVIAGFMRIKPDGVATIPASNALSVQGTEGDSISIGEVI